jgi:hypothetical protein
MPDFMIMIEESETAEQQRAPAATRALVEGRTAFERKLRAGAAFLDGERLRPSSEAKRVRIRGGKTQVETGPFAESALTAYYAVKADTLEAALALAEQLPMSPASALDVRPIMKGNYQPDKTSQQGRVYAFAVLGSSPNEQGWIEVMDRIDASRRGLDRDRVLAGVRLEAPGRGRRVVASGNQRTIFDGPFLESKEVIGGVFFMRFSSIGEAVEWASGCEFVEHGTVEIRELWRS